MRHLISGAIFVSFSLLSHGAVSLVQVGSSARQQGVVIFQVADPAQCTVTVYADAALTQKMDDTNNAVFPGSESCVRAFNVINGSQVTAVLGRRTSEAGADGKLHSRSLAVSTPYWVRVVDLKDGSTATASFTTANIPWGDTHIETPLPNSDAFGGLAYPDLDWSDAGADKTYVDPLTGVAFRRGARNQYGQGGLWGDGTNDTYAFNTPLDVQGSWTNAGSALGTSPSGPFASYSGSSQAPLFLPFSTGHRIFADKGFQSATDNSTLKSLDDVTVTIYGFAAGASVEDRKVLVCLAVNYVPASNVCPGTEIEVTLPTSAGASSAIPASYPAWQFAGWNVGRVLNSDEVAIYTGTATVTNSVVTATGNSYLPLNAVAGMKININGTWYTIQSIKTAANFTLAESNVSVSGPWYLGNFGIRIRKKTATNNQVNVSASFSYAYTIGTQIDANGQNRDYCSRLTVPVTYAADGTTLLATPRQGRLCTTGSGYQYIFLLLDDGTTRFLSFVGHAGQQPQLPMLGGFSAADPYTYVALGSDPGDPNGGPTFWKATYDYATCKFRTWTGNGYNRTHPGPDDCFRWTNMNPYGGGNTITNQLTTALASNPMWDNSLGMNFTFSGISGNYAVLSKFAVTQDGPCLISVFDMTTFNMVKLFDSFFGTVPGLRWGGCHSNGLELVDGAGNGSFQFVGLSAKNYSGYLSGAYPIQNLTAKSLDGGTTWSADTSLGPGTLIDTATSSGKCGSTPWVVGSQCVDLTNVAGPCGSNSFGVTGNQCVKVKITSDVPCSPNADSREAAKWPCPWHAGWGGPLILQPGDYISRWTAIDGGTQYDGKNEKFRVLSKTADGSGNWILDLQRWSKCDNPWSSKTATPPACQWLDHLYSGYVGSTHPNGWQAFASNDAGDTWINLGTPLASTTWKSDDSPITSDGGHNTIGIGPDGASIMELGGGTSRVGVLPDMSATPPQFTFNLDSHSFAGVAKAVNVLETYPTLGNWKGGTVQKRSLYWNWRHINPSYGIAGDQPVKIWGHTYTPVAGQSSTYQMDIHNDIGNQKERRPNVFSTRYGFKDISGPGSSIDDSKPFTFCYVGVAGECMPNSNAGQLFVVAPGAWVEFGGCIVNSLKVYAPCAANLESDAAWMIEGDTQKDDPLGNRFRRITMGLTGPGAQYGYTSPHLSPDIGYAMVRPAWLNGIKPDFMVLKMPPPPATDSVDRSNYVDVPNVFGPGSGYVRIRFGYAETGGANQFYCTSRQEACVTDASIAPFAYAQTERLTAQDCRNGCTIHVPALSGRVLYYRVEKSADGATQWVSGPTQIAAVQ